VATGAVDRVVYLWDVASGGQIAQLTGHGGAVLALAFSPDGSTLYSGGADRRVLVWDLAGSRRFITKVVAGSLFGAQPGLAVPSPDGRSVAYAGTTSAQGQVQFLDVASGNLDPARADPNGGRLVVWLPPDDRAVITVGADRSLRRWDRAAGRVVTERPVAAAAISALAADPGGAFVVVGDRAGTVEVVDARSLAPVGAATSLGHPVTALAVLPDRRVVGLLADGSYAVVDPAAASVSQLGDLGVDGLAAAVSADGIRLAVGGSHGEVGLFDLADRSWIAPPRAGHSQYVVSAAFSADGRTLVTSSLDGSVRIWDGRTGESLISARVDRSALSLVMLADGETALAAAHTGAVYRVDTDFTRWIASACAVAGRDLTVDEWHAVFGDRPTHPICPIG